MIERPNAVVGEIRRTAKAARRVALIDRAAFVAGASLCVVIFALAGMPVAQVIRSALGIPSQSQGLGG